MAGGQEVFIVERGEKVRHRIKCWLVNEQGPFKVILSTGWTRRVSISSAVAQQESHEVYQT